MANIGSAKTYMISWVLLRNEGQLKIKCFRYIFLILMRNKNK